MSAPSPPTGSVVGRRTFLRTATVLAVGGAAVASASPVAAQEDGTDGTDLADWFADVSNYEGVADERGTTDVTVTVGAADGFAFGPAAVRVDPGTTVTWEWTGEGGSHNVAAEDGAYESDLLSTAGETFEHTFDAESVSLYACSPHKAMGMKGAVVVGDVSVEAPQPEYEPVDREPDYGGWFDDVDNFEGTVDLRGREEVHLQVGADGNGGGYAISPPAVHIDPGTRVVWEWVGEDGPHRFADSDGGYESPELSTGTWGLQFDGVGVSKYGCEPHHDRGMKGAIVVGDVFDGVHTLTTSDLTLLGGLGAAVLSPLAFGAYLWARGVGPDPEESSP